MNNLILGSSGFLGKYLCEYLRKKGENVVEFDIIKGNDCRYDKLPLEYIDRVYFLAWMVGGSKYLYDPKTQKEQLDWNKAIINNVMMQLNDIPFIFTSSQLAENCNTVYGILKRLGEIETGLTKNGKSVRLWNIYGAYEPSNIKSHVIADLIHQALNSGKIDLLTDGSEKRQFIHVEDVCDALYQAFDSCGNGPYHITSGNWQSISSVASFISEFTSSKIYYGEKPGETILTSSEPKIPWWQHKINLYGLDGGLKQTIELFKEKLACTTQKSTDDPRSYSL